MAHSQVILGTGRCVAAPRPRTGCMIRRLMGLMLGILLAALPARAFVLEGPQVLELVVKTMDQAQALRVVQKVTIEDGADADHPLVLDETLSYLFPDRLRSEIGGGENRRIQVISMDQTLTVVDGRRTDDAVSRLDRYKTLLLYRSRPLLHKMLLDYGVDVEKSSLGRFEDKIVLVIGSQYPDESVSQVWVDKESFLPLRWLDIPSTGTGDRLEFIYRQWQKKGDVWYPLSIEIYQNGLLIRRIDVADVSVNPALPLEWFDIPYLTTTYPAAERPEPTEPGGNNSADEVKRTIEEFQKKFDE